MKAVKYERTAAQEARLIVAERKAKEIAARDGVTIAEAMKQIYLDGGKKRKSGKKAGKGRAKKSNRSTPKKSNSKKGGSMLDYIGEKLSGR